MRSAAQQAVEADGLWGFGDAGWQRGRQREIDEPWLWLKKTGWGWAIGEDCIGWRWIPNTARSLKTEAVVGRGSRLHELSRYLRQSWWGPSWEVKTVLGSWGKGNVPRSRCAGYRIEVVIKNRIKDILFSLSLYSDPSSSSHQGRGKPKSA